ncbi:MAG: DUF4381 domain-containing protein [Gammaproteobacteria bacterium]|nr:DUF4381 domain-containing protein [Gammaproteobacteria bacterium]
MPENQSANPLDQLPPLHMPEPISLWPPAIGWWLLALFIIVLSVLVVRFFLKKKRKNQLRKAALLELSQYWSSYQSDHDTQSYLLAVNRLLKKFVMQQYPNKSLHTLSGEQWISGLAELSPQSGINRDSAAILLSIYSKQLEKSEQLDKATQQVNALHPLLLKWFKGLRLAS